jgi:hypothetical protein
MKAMNLAGEMRYLQNDRAGNAKMSGNKKPKSAAEKLRLVGRASPAGLSYLLLVHNIGDLGQ